VSPHVFIDRAGKVTQYVPFNKRAWHAGISQWNGRQDCNNFSVGIELEGTIASDYTSDQYLVLNELLIVLINNYDGLSRDSIVGHQEIAPGRKFDPGPCFSWETVSRALS
jgi:AmpD protein